MKHYYRKNRNKRYKKKLYCKSKLFKFFVAFTIHFFLTIVHLHMDVVVLQLVQEVAFLNNKFVIIVLQLYYIWYVCSFHRMLLCHVIIIGV